MTGTQALVRLPMTQQLRDEAAGLDTACMITGYRGSPLGNFDRALWQARPFIEKHRVHFMPGVNEDTAATALWGTQQVGLFPGAKHDGVFAIWYGKGPGVDRTMDVFKHANLAGTAAHGGVLALAGDDHVCASSTTAHQSEFDFMGADHAGGQPGGRAGVPGLRAARLGALALRRGSGSASSASRRRWTAPPSSRWTRTG